MTPPFIYINGYPGVGKLTVARELLKLIPNAKLVDNHHFIDPVAIVYERWMPEYQPLRKLVRNGILTSIANSTSTLDRVWIFTDQQSSDEIGSATAQEYFKAARSRDSFFISVILTCHLEENIKRMRSRERKDTKLTDIGVLKTIRETEDIFRFGGEAEVEMDVTQMLPEEAARLICDIFKRHWQTDYIRSHSHNFIEHKPTPMV